jgi:integrase
MVYPQIATRAGEIVGLQWADFDFDKLTLLIQRGVVHGRVDDVKTEYSRDFVPLAPELARELLAYRDRCHATQEGWLFANPATDRPYHQEEIQKKHIKKAAKAAGITAKVGWKTFRHSYRSWLDQTEAPVGVQRELMRHASIQTTMNVYGRAMTDSKRQAHGNVVQMVLQEKSTIEPTEQALAAIVG